MKKNIFPTFKKALSEIATSMIHTGQVVYTDKWQGIKMKENQRFFESLGVSFTVPINHQSLQSLQEDIKPNLPWADVHFEERVSGIPLNPGESYKIWPFYGRDKQVRNENEKFSHTYMERMWPKFAGKEFELREQGIGNRDYDGHSGIRYEYGDLNSVIKHLKEDLYSRQAFLPIWFPEDTGVEHGGRVPCSLGYHFIIRNNYLHCTYYLRSCDFLRHLQDDLYLAVRLMSFIADELGVETKIYLGSLTTHIVSLHIFEQEVPRLKHFV